MKKIIIMSMLSLSVLLTACGEKKISIDEFRADPNLRAEWLKKCGNTDEITGNCFNAKEAEQKERNKAMLERSKKISGIDSSKSD